MTRRAYLLLFLLGLAIAAGIAAFQPAPGYMDADYSYATGKQLASGKGFLEPFLWNYLDDPEGLPHPSFLYWMPLAGLVAAAGMWASGIHTFFTARLGFILLAACLPPVTAGLAASFGLDRRAAWLAGLLALFPGFYLPFLTTTDTFGIYMLLGVGFLQASRQAIYASTNPGSRSRGIIKWCFLTGLLAGLMHMARADGVLWVLVGLVAAWSAARKARLSNRGSGIQSLAGVFGAMMAVLAGYLLVMAPWMARNILLGGSFSAPGASRALLLTHYDELFIYPGGLLTVDRWWAAGLGELLQARLLALGQNLQTVLAVQGEVFLLPLILVGLWHFRNDERVRLAAFAWALTFLAMTFVFPFQGMRGGFFHSGAAIQPLLWALAPAGLARLVAVGERSRRWIPGQAGTVFAAGVVALAILVTCLTAYSRLNGEGNVQRGWGAGEAAYARLEVTLSEAGAHPGSAVLVNNPPGYFGATGRPALAIPDGGESATLAVARRYRGEYMLLERDHPRGLEDLYRNPGDRPGFDYLISVDGAHLFFIRGH